MTLSNAGLQQRGKWLVRGVSLTVGRGELVTLVGPNGSGKSSTAKMMLGINQPSEGSVVSAPGIRKGYVPQKIHIDWTVPLTVLGLMRLTGRVDKATCHGALERTGGLHLLKKPVQELSGGEFQRVMIARALLTRPDLLVLDEPTQGVDLTGELELYEMIAQLKDELNCGVLLISHDLHMVMAATDRVICLNGHICCEGTPQAVAESDVYHQLIGPKAAAAFAFYNHRHDHEHLPDGTVRQADGSITQNCHPENEPHAHAHNGSDKHAG